MITVVPTDRIYLCCGATDMRRGINPRGSLQIPPGRVSQTPPPARQDRSGARMVGHGEIKDPALRFSPPPAATAGAGHGAKSRETAA